MKPEVNMSALCREYGVSRKTGYKWLARYRKDGLPGLQERSRRPHHSPNQTTAEVEQVIVQAREQHPVWGGRKLKRWLENRGYGAIPVPSTVTEILRRHGKLDEQESLKHKAWTRFEMEQPNDLWQMDFKGHFALENGERCHPLTVLDDHSRFLIGLKACANETTESVHQQVKMLFQRHGLPKRMLMDNGKPWGSKPGNSYTRFTVWLMRLGIKVSHGRPYHPQTQGKDERLHRTLKSELLRNTRLADLDDCQSAFDDWRSLYNLERPHEALDLDCPSAHYRPSPRPFPKILPALVFPLHSQVRKVSINGIIGYRSRNLLVGRAFSKQAVGLLYDDLDDGIVHVYFNNIRIRSFDLIKQVAL